MSKRKGEDGGDEHEHPEKKHKGDGDHKGDHGEDGGKKDGCHVEIPVTDMERAKKFYKDTFGFKFTDWQPHYTLFACPNPKSIGGGLYKHTDFATSKPGIIVYLHADDIGKKHDEVFANGGYVYKNSEMIMAGQPAHGACSTICDTEGNFMGVHTIPAPEDTKVRTIEQTVQFKLKPAAVYANFMDAKKHTVFSGEPAEISTEVRGLSKLWGGKVEARNIELEENKLIVQSWRCTDWPTGHFSRLTIELSSKSRGTELKLKHEHVPVDKADSVEKGWYERYWNKFGEGDKTAAKK